MKRIVIILFVIITLLSYNLITLYIFNLKSKKVFSRKNTHSKFPFKIQFKSIKNTIEKKLANLSYPYKITTKKYLITKVFLSPIIFILAIINYKNIFIPFVVFVLTFLYQDYLIYLYKKEEKIKILNELKNLNTNLILCLSTYAPLKLAFKNSKQALKYQRFINTFEDFLRDYELNGYNLSKSLKRIEEKFNSYELSVFTSLLRQGEKEGNIIENLERFSETLEFNYFKYLKRQTAKRLLYVTLGTVLSLINIITIVMYPIIIKVMGNLQVIFS